MLFLLLQVAHGTRRGQQTARVGAFTCLEQQFWKKSAYRRHWAAI